MSDELFDKYRNASRREGCIPAIFFLCLIALFIWSSTVFELSHEKTIRKILSSQNYCTQKNTVACYNKQYLLVTPDSMSLQEMVRRNDWSEYIHSAVCMEGKIRSARLDNEFWGYCTIRRDPSFFSLDEKLEDAYLHLRKELRSY